MRLVLQTLRNAADQVLRWDMPKLTAVVFVVDGERSRELKQWWFAFLRTKHVDPFGKQRHVIVPIEPHMVKHHAPCADILDEEKFVFA
jgi:hypothetical protein